MYSHIPIYLVFQVMIFDHMRAVFQDHTVTWSRKNPMFANGKNILRVNGSDNIIFLCHPDAESDEQLFWATDLESYRKCSAKKKTSLIKLLDCSPKGAIQEFILKVAQFSEIPYIPTFSPGVPIYFIGQQRHCSGANLKLTVELSASNSAVNAIGKRTEQSEHGTNVTRRFTGWMRYRFLLIPGVLGLLTFIGLVGLMIAFCRPRVKHLLNHRNVNQKIKIGEPKHFDLSKNCSPNRRWNAVSTFENTQASSRIGISNVPKNLFADDRRKLNVKIDNSLGQNQVICPSTSNPLDPVESASPDKQSHDYRRCTCSSVREANGTIASTKAHIAGRTQTVHQGILKNTNVAHKRFQHTDNIHYDTGSIINITV